MVSVNVNDKLVAARSAGDKVYPVIGFVATSKLFVPPVQVTDDVAPLNEPFRIMSLYSQMAKSGPAFTLADSLTLKSTSIKAGTQGPAPSGSLVVNRKVNVFPTSANVVVYDALTVSPVILLVESVPVPVSNDQLPAFALPPTVPVRIMDVGSQTSTEVEGTETRAVGLTRSVKLLFTTAHCTEALVTVSVNVIVVLISPAPTVYTGFKAVASFRLPVPVCVHKVLPLELEAITDREAKSKVGVPSQIASLLPAITTGAGVMVKVMKSFCVTQLPFPIAVSVNVIVPVSVGAEK